MNTVEINTRKNQTSGILVGAWENILLEMALMPWDRKVWFAKNRFNPLFLSEMPVRSQDHCSCFQLRGLYPSFRVYQDFIRGNYVITLNTLNKPEKFDSIIGDVCSAS